MAAQLADRVQETWTGTGTGSMSLAGAVGGFQSFASAFPAASTAGVSYAVYDQAGNWETGHGTYTLAGTTLTRNVVASSNANALVSFPAGTKQVFCTLLASDAGALYIANAWTATQRGAPVTLVQTTGTINIDASLGNNFEVQLTQNATIAAPTNLAAGAVFNLSVQQPAAGGPYTLTFASVWDFGGAGAPVASVTASKVDFVSGYYHSPTTKIISSYRKGT